MRQSQRLASSHPLALGDGLRSSLDDREPLLITAPDNVDESRKAGSKAGAITDSAHDGRLIERGSL